jgi:high-affinity nickel permease
VSTVARIPLTVSASSWIVSFVVVLLVAVAQHITSKNLSRLHEYGAPRWTIIDKPYIFIIKTKNIKPIANIEREIKKYNSKHANIMRNSQI